MKTGELQDIQKGLDSLKSSSNTDEIKKGKYIRREGTKGNYKYIYAESQGKGGSEKEDDVVFGKTIDKQLIKPNDSSKIKAIKISNLIAMAAINDNYNESESGKKSNEKLKLYIKENINNSSIDERNLISKEMSKIGGRVTTNIKMVEAANKLFENLSKQESQKEPDKNSKLKELDGLFAKLDKVQENWKPGDKESDKIINSIEKIVKEKNISKEEYNSIKKKYDLDLPFEDFPKKQIYGEGFLQYLKQGGRDWD